MTGVYISYTKPLKRFTHYLRVDTVCANQVAVHPLIHSNSVFRGPNSIKNTFWKGELATLNFWFSALSLFPPIFDEIFIIRWRLLVGFLGGFVVFCRT